MKRRVSIVFQESGHKTPDGDPEFEVFIEGIDMKALAHIAESDWSPAEWWGVRMFGIVLGHMNQAGAVKTMLPKRPVGSA